MAHVTNPYEVIKLARRYLEQIDNNIAFTHKKNMLENSRFPKISSTQTWKSCVLPTKGTRTTRGSIFRSQLSNSNKAPVHLPLLPQVHYQQFCQSKAVHGSDEPRPIQGLVIEQINLERDPAPHLINKRDALPPIRRRHQDRINRLETKENVEKPTKDEDNEKHNKRIVDKDGNIKWTEDCSCMRCELMKNDYEVGIDDRYDHWGQYPCVPDAVINRDGQESSIDSGENRPDDPDK